MAPLADAMPTAYERLFLRAARLVWFSLTTISLALFISGLPGRYIQLVETTDPRILRQIGISATSYASYFLLVNILLVAAHYSIATVLFFFRKKDWMVLWLAFAFVTNGVIFPLSLMYPPDTTPVPARTMVEIIIFTGLLSSISLLFLFPDGKFVPRWTIRLLVVWALINLPGILYPDSAFSLRNWPPIVQLLILTVMSGTGVAAQIYRYNNVSNPTQRQQAKWAAFGLTAAVLGPFAYFLPFVILPSIVGNGVPNLLFNRIGPSFYIFSFLFQVVLITIFSVFSLAFPVSFAIAILRYKLWDIDIFFNRALVYGALTGLIAVIYITSVVLLQRLIQLMTGYNQSEVATAVSTLLIAVTFVPLQRRVQTVVDKRFYRQKYDSARTLASFNATLRDDIELEPLVDSLFAVIQDTMQPEQVSLWLREPVDLKDPLVETESVQEVGAA